MKSTPMNDKWLIEFKGRNSSLSTNQNFLWKHENIYIMDNHRTALWCWLQEIKAENKYNIFHIDAHYDTRPVEDVDWLENLPDLSTIGVHEYLNIEGSDNGLGKYPAILWDNYLSLFIRLYPCIISDFFTATHLLGEPPREIHFEEIRPYKLSQYFRDYLENTDSASKCIVNLDLDYFFNRQPEKVEIMFSMSYINEIFDTIKQSLEKGKIEVLTICLSPECCGGWRQAESLCDILAKKLEISFALPCA